MLNFNSFFLDWQIMIEATQRAIFKSTYLSEQNISFNFEYISKSDRGIGLLKFIK
jgi:hypothetical protein